MSTPVDGSALGLAVGVGTGAPVWAAEVLHGLSEGGCSVRTEVTLPNLPTIGSLILSNDANDGTTTPTTPAELAAMRASSSCQK
jgi:hypothetical protein